MSDGYVQLPPEGAGKKIDASELTRAEGTIVERQRVVLADATDPEILARLGPQGQLPVTNDPVLQELRNTNRLLAVLVLQMASMTGLQINPEDLGD